MNVRSYDCCQPKNSETAKVLFLSDTLKLVSDSSRLKILCILRQGDHCVCEIVEHLDMSQSLISNHLRDLKDANIVSNSKKGSRVYYSLTEKGKHISSLLFQIPIKDQKL